MFVVGCVNLGTRLGLYREELRLDEHRPVGYLVTSKPDLLPGCSQHRHAVVVTLTLSSSLLRLLLLGRQVCPRRRSSTVRGYLVTWPGGTYRKKGIRSVIGRESVEKMAHDTRGCRVYDWITTVA